MRKVARQLPSREGSGKAPLEGSWPRSGRKGGLPAQKEPVRGKPGSRHSRLYFLAAQRKKAGRPFFKGTTCFASLDHRSAMRAALSGSLGKAGVGSVWYQYTVEQ